MAELGLEFVEGIMNCRAVAGGGVHFLGEAEELVLEEFGRAVIGEVEEVVEVGGGEGVIFDEGFEQFAFVEGLDKGFIEVEAEAGLLFWIENGFDLGFLFGQEAEAVGLFGVFALLVACEVEEGFCACESDIEQADVVVDGVVFGGDFEVFGEADLFWFGFWAPDFVLAMEDEDFGEFEAFGAVGGEEVDGLRRALEV